MELVSETSNGTFDGYIRDGLRNGPGVEKWSDGTLIDSNFIDDKMNGLTLFKEGGTGGEVYQGEYKKGFKEGYGHQMLQGGESYFGGWRRDAKSDEGVAVS